jgi:hypothetical protein
MFKSLDEFLKQASETLETSEASESTEPVEANASEDGAQDIDWSTAVEQAVNAVWDNESSAEGVVEELDESEDGVDNSADLGDQEIARTSQQLGIPPSVLLKAKAYDYTMQAMRQQGQIPYPFMVNESSVSSAPFAQSASRLIPNARPFRPEESRTQRTGFTSLEEFLRQMGIPE